MTDDAESRVDVMPAVNTYYSRRLAEYGPTSRGVDWNGRASQETRYGQLLQIVHDTSEPSRAPYSDWLIPEFEAAWRSATAPDLSTINYALLVWVCGLLRIDTPIRHSVDFQTRYESTERLVDICRQLDATTYVSGPAARSYLREEEFARHGIEVEYCDYAGFPAYEQLGSSTFRHDVSVIDALFMCGPHARDVVCRETRRRH